MKLCGFEVGPHQPLFLIAGPCTAESLELCLEVAGQMQEICARLKPELKKRGLLFTGIDVIGPFLTEINVTSPTGLRQVKAFGGIDIAAMIWDAVEKKVGKAGKVRR